MDYLSLIKQPIEGDLDDFNNLFNSSLSHTDGLLSQALAYIRQRTGKRMRPMLILLMARNFGDVTDVTQNAAVGLELLHTASLVHDDVVDESDERRGQASANSVYGNQIAVLVGDYILSLSLQQAARTGSLPCVEIIATLGATLSEGEVFQLANVRNEQANEDDYFHVIDRKTAALFAACGELAALTAGADASFVENARRFGAYIGICFQIRDDIFDYFSDSAIGKPTANDMAEGKLTLPALYALRQTDDPAVQALAARIKAREASPDDILRMVAFTKENGGIEYATKRMQEYRQKAEACLERFQNPAVRKALTDYLNYVVDRTY